MRIWASKSPVISIGQPALQLDVVVMASDVISVWFEKSGRAMTALNFRRCVHVCLVAVFSFGSWVMVASADGRFPFDQDLMMDTAPMRPSKRIPSITVSANGAAQIDLWCRSVKGRIDLGERTIAISAEPLPEAMPQWMSPGQCTPERMQADESILSALTQATGWRVRGRVIELIGPTTLRFWPSTH